MTRPTVSTEAIVVDAITNGRAVVSTAAFAEIRHRGRPALARPRSSTAPGPAVAQVQAAPGIDLRDPADLRQLRPDRRGRPCKTPRAGPLRRASSSWISTRTRTSPCSASASGRCLGRSTTSTQLRVPRFTTNPVFVDVDGNGEFDAPGDKSCDLPAVAARCAPGHGCAGARGRRPPSARPWHGRWVGRRCGDIFGDDLALLHYVRRAPGQDDSKDIAVNASEPAQAGRDHLECSVRSEAPIW